MNSDQLIDKQSDPIKISDNLWQIKLPIWNSKIINTWVLQNPENNQFTIVDTGSKNPNIRKVWEKNLKDINATDINGVVVTHYHPDHGGECLWLTQTYQAPLLTSSGEFFLAHAWKNQIGPFSFKSFSDFYALISGYFLPEDQESYARYSHIYLSGDWPVSFVAIDDGDTLITNPNWTCYHGWGHTTQHVFLFNKTENFLITGDLVLPEITPNIGFWPYSLGDNPLKQYFRTLKKMCQFPEDVMVLPSHGDPFIGLHQRINQTLEHHNKRLRKTYDLLNTKEPTLGVDVTRGLFGELPLHILIPGIAEAMAHLIYLVEEGYVLKKQEGVAWLFSKNPDKSFVETQLEDV